MTAIKCTDEGDDMLMLWAAKIADRRTIVEFWDWLSEQPEESKFLLGNRVGDVLVEKALDEFHGINQSRLEKQRRALLEMFGQRKRSKDQTKTLATKAVQ